MKNLLAACAAGFILAAAGVEKAPDALKVVFYCDRGVGVDLVGRLMDDCPEFVVTFANGKDIGEGALDGADMVVHSGGSGESQFFGLGEKGVAAEREFVKKGGLYHGTCAGAFLVLEETRRKRNQMVPFKPDDPEHYRGGATVELEFTEAGCAAMGQKGPRMVRYHGGPAMIPGKPVEGADMKVFAYYGKKMEKIEKPEADVRGMAGKAAIIAGTFGKGKIFICGPHPESGRRTQDIFYKGLEWLTGRKLHPSPKKRIAGAPNVYAQMGYNTPEGARLLQKVWHSTDYNRALSSAKGDVALLIDPKKKTFKELKDFKGPVVVLSTHADTAAEIKASGRKDLIVAASAAEASAKLKDSLAKLKADKAKLANFFEVTPLRAGRGSAILSAVFR